MYLPKLSSKRHAAKPLQQVALIHYSSSELKHSLLRSFAITWRCEQIIRKKAAQKMKVLRLRVYPNTGMIHRKRQISSDENGAISSLLQ